VEKVLACLLTSTLTQHLIACSQPPTTEHVYAQWHEREELRSRAPQGTLQTENVPRLEVKQEEVPHPTEPTRGLHFRKNRPFRLNKLNGKRGRAGRPSKSEERLSKADLDTGWSKDDGRQCSLCQKYGDAKSNEAGRLLYLGQNEWAHINCSVVRQGVQGGQWLSDASAQCPRLGALHGEAFFPSSCSLCVFVQCPSSL
uniref:PHD-type domain-containing protein n=1 Tax=Hucho hucho TaxID=62062 RepID=A0A4W5KZG0_9TELE